MIGKRESVLGNKSRKIKRKSAEKGVFLTLTCIFLQTPLLPLVILRAVTRTVLTLNQIRTRSNAVCVLVIMRKINV